MTSDIQSQLNNFIEIQKKANDCFKRELNSIRSNHSKSSLFVRSKRKTTSSSED